MPGFQRSALQIGLAIFLAAFFVAILGAFLAALPASAANALEKKRGGDQCRVFNALLCKSGWQSFLLPFLWPFLAPFLPRYPLQRRMRSKRSEAVINAGFSTLCFANRVGNLSCCLFCGHSWRLSCRVTRFSGECARKEARR